ncbi:hypothetical protein LEMLEM_LOCUS4137, partial [Lemmus lemmus]
VDARRSHRLLTNRQDRFSERPCLKKAQEQRRKSQVCLPPPPILWRRHTHLHLDLPSQFLSSALRQVSFSADVCRSCLLDLGSEDLKEWDGLQSNAVDSLASVSVCFYT